MRKRSRFIIPIFLFSVSLAFGIWLGFQINDRNQKTPSVSPTPDENQQSLLVIGVDRAGTAGARLQALWYIGYLPRKFYLTFMPLYPVLPSGYEKRARVLTDKFQFTEDRSIHPDFLRAVHDAFGLDWDVTIVVDDIGMMEIVDFAGGVNSSAGTMNGPMVIGMIPPAWEDPIGAMQGQANLISYLCEHPPDQTPEAFIQKYQELTPEHLQLDMLPEMALKAWQELISGHTALSCEFPSLSADNP